MVRMNADANWIQAVGVLPFGLLVAGMALGPVVWSKGWGRHYGKVAIGLALWSTGWTLGREGVAGAGPLLTVARDFLSFAVLTGALYVVAGAIRIEAPGVGGPVAKGLFLLAGGLAANGLGTTGAAILLIQPWLQLNGARPRAYQVAFFIAMVANVGGGLTPLGDPPLLLGWLQGVPFWWVAAHCWGAWILAMGTLLGLFWIADWWLGERRPVEVAAGGKWRVTGGHNLVWLVVIIGAVVAGLAPGWRELVLAGAAWGAYRTTAPAARAANGFAWGPLEEVVLLFLGLFATMPPVLEWLPGVTARWAAAGPGVWFWGVGGLSSWLDNAPTYWCAVRSLAARAGVAGGGGMIGTELARGAFAAHLAAVSVGAVFFGANTYIGNAPNLLVKAMAEARGVRMPGFGGYLVRFTLPLLLPVWLLVWAVCFRR